MKTETKKIDSTKREINIEVEGELVKNKFEDVFKQIAKEAKVPGFRVGNAPRDILEKNYSSFAHEQVIKELVPDIYNQAIEKEKLEVVELPQISDVKLERSKLSFKATVEISPEINVRNYKNIKINYKKPVVSADEIKRQIDSLKESRKLDTLDDNFAKGLGYPSLAELEKSIELQTLLSKQERERQRIDNEVVETVTKDLDFKLPQSLITRQLQDLIRHAKVDLAMKGFPRDKIDAQEKEMEKNLEPEAKRQVKVYLILSQIAKKENIPLDDNMPRKVMELLLKEADWKIDGSQG
jgi:FKBP-type peptidyl-prolyl cis-trans isomerase (trigger factor)